MSERKKTPVNILVETKVTQEDEFKEFFIEIKGNMVTVGDVLYIRYEEEMEGVDSPVPVTVKILPTGEVTLIRSGDVKTKLHFTYQERKESHYDTPFGMMMIATNTKKMAISLRDNPNSGHLMIDYDLLAGEEKLGEYHLDLKFNALL